MSQIPMAEPAFIVLSGKPCWIFLPNELACQAQNQLRNGGNIRTLRRRRRVPVQQKPGRLRRRALAIQRRHRRWPGRSVWTSPEALTLPAAECRIGRQSLPGNCGRAKLPLCLAGRRPHRRSRRRASVAEEAGIRPERNAPSVREDRAARQHSPARIRVSRHGKPFAQASSHWIRVRKRLPGCCIPTSSCERFIRPSAPMCAGAPGPGVRRAAERLQPSPQTTPGTPAAGMGSPTPARTLRSTPAAGSS